MENACTIKYDTVTTRVCDFRHVGLELQFLDLG